MNIVRKDAALTTTGADEDFPGTFEVILSAPTEDRDGETLLPGEWKMPLPERITFDSDHGMSVATTVGSGVPTLNDAGELVVSGTFSSLARAQEVRTLVKEGHIATTSVAFMTARAPQKDGKGAIVRELLNGAFVAIPSNREALVLSSKSGARNSASDAKHIKAIYDRAVALGGGPAAGKGLSVGTLTIDIKAESEDPATDVEEPLVAVIARVESSVSDALDLLNALDATTLPAEVQQAIALIASADTDLDELLELVGIPDADEDAEPAAETDAAAAEKSAAAAIVKAAGDADSVEMQNRALQALASAYLTE